MKRLLPCIVTCLILACLPLPAHAFDFFGLFRSKPAPPEDDRTVTIEQIRELQAQLILLQGRLSAQEKLRAQELAAKSGGKPPALTGPGESNWQEVDQAHLNPGQFGIYTYLLFAGSEADTAARGSLDNLLQSIEALPPSNDPPLITNRFLVPVAQQQSLVVQARRPYDYKLARTFLERLGLEGLADGPVLVSTIEPLDPFGRELVQPYLAVVLGRYEQKRNLPLTRVWHGYEKPPLPIPGHPLADLYWQVIDGAGVARVTRSGGKLLVDLSPPAANP